MYTHLDGDLRMTLKITMPRKHVIIFLTNQIICEHTRSKWCKSARFFDDGLICSIIVLQQLTSMSLDLYQETASITSHLSNPQAIQVMVIMILGITENLPVNNLSWTCAILNRTWLVTSYHLWAKIVVERGHQRHEHCGAPMHFYGKHTVRLSVVLSSHSSNISQSSLLQI
jgi:hypothetical protein